MVQIYNWRQHHRLLIPFRALYLCHSTDIDNMTKKALLVALLITSQALVAQTPETYTNSRGDRHIAGPFQLDLLRTDTTFKKWFDESYQKFSLKGESTKWKKSLKNTEVDIYLGTWCGDSKNWVPQFVKMWTDLGLKEEQLKFTALYDGIEKYKQGPNAEEKGLRIHRVPTFIFKEKGEEYARIVEYPRNDLEQDLAQIAVGYASEPNYRAATYLLNLFENTSLEDIWKDINNHFTEVYHLVGKDSELNTLGYVLDRSGRKAEALIVFQMNSIIYRHTPRAFANFGKALEDAGRNEEAIAAFKRALELDPKNETAIERLAVLAPEEGQ